MNQQLCRHCSKSLPKLSRPQRLRAILLEVEKLGQEYQNWFGAIPENLEQSELACQLEEAIEQLEQAKELLTELDLPRGFGR